jgi:nicotinate-nucleotide adenylyltransferase
MKIGLFFGSFNPIHNGHLIIASYFAEFTDLQQVWLVVSPHNPLKDKKTLLSNLHRLQLVRLSVADNNKLKASDIEFKLPQPSYTIKSLSYISEKYPKHEFVLIMGTDNLNTLHKWKNYEQILEHYQIYAYPRPESDGGEFKNHPHVKIIEGVPLMELSSTFIRMAVMQNKDVRYTMPEAAYNYMKEMHFYEK